MRVALQNPTGERLGWSARRRLPSAFLRIACLLICGGANCNERLFTDRHLRIRITC